MKEENRMAQEVAAHNPLYEFIGRLALALFSQNIKMGYRSLSHLLQENGYPNQDEERAQQVVADAYILWERAEQNCRLPITSLAIAHTYVDESGYPSWLDA